MAISDDGLPVANAELMRRALLYARHFGIPVVQHAEDLALTGSGVMHEGEWSTRLGLPGIPGSSEDVVVARDLLLTEDTGGRYHVAHLSTARSLELVRSGQGAGAGGELRGHPPPPPAHRPRGGDAGVRDRRQDEAAAARRERPRGAPRRPRRRHRRRHRQRPCPPPRRREGRRVLGRPVRHHRPGDHAVALPRPPGAAGGDHPRPPDRAAVHRAGAGLQPARRHARPGQPGRRHLLRPRPAR